MEQEAQLEEQVNQDAGGNEERLRRVVGRYRELLVAANPDAVPELIQGGDTEALDGSLVAAKAAYARAKEAARAELAASPSPVNPLRRNAPPAGIESAGPLAKIAWGLSQGERS